MKKKNSEQEALSDFQNLDITGRTDISDTDSDYEDKEISEDEPQEQEGLSFAGEPFFQQRDYIPTGAKLTDGKCQYSFRITSGLNRGEEHKVKGALLVDDDLHTAVSHLAAHLAAVMDDFKLAGVEVLDIDREHGHELSCNYYVEGLEVKGEADAETVTILGSRRVTLGRIEVKSFKIPVDPHSSYRWSAQLREAVLSCLMEVALYREGKGTPEHVDQEEEEARQAKKQLKISFAEPVEVDEFEGGKL